MPRIFDSHVHIYPDKIAMKASESIGRFYEIPMMFDGSVRKLLELGKTYGIERFLVHSVATVPRQVEQINDFIASQVRVHSNLIGFATLHPGMESVEQEVERVLGLGLKGIKLHPDFQLFNLDDPSVFPIYAAAEGRIPVLVHTGDYRHGYSHPGRVPAILKNFPKLNLVCAHLGGYSQWEEAREALKGLDVWVDTSSSLSFLDPDVARRMISDFGTERVLFGSDYPMWDPGDELRLLDELRLSPDTMDKILSGNLIRLLGLRD